MHQRLLKPRAGLSLVELLIALVLAGIIGAAGTGLFVSQSRLLDQQEKLGSARAVSRGAANVMLSELRMVERTGGIVPPVTNRRITLNVPYAIGTVCKAGGTLVFSRMPVPQYVLDDADFTGYAYRALDGTYTYVTGSAQPSNGSLSDCTAVNVAVLPGGAVRSVAPGGTADPGSPVLLLQRVTYEIKPHATIPGAFALWRTTATRWNEELVAPLGPNAMFRFFVNDATAAQTAVPADLTSVTGLELTLDALSDRPNPDGTRQRVPYRTAVFFRNRL